MHRPILRALHRRRTRQGRAGHRNESPRLSLRARTGPQGEEICRIVSGRWEPGSRAALICGTEESISCDRCSLATACGIASGPFVHLHPVRAAALPVPHRESRPRAIFGPAHKGSNPRRYRNTCRNRNRRLFSNANHSSETARSTAASAAATSSGVPYEGTSFAQIVRVATTTSTTIGVVTGRTLTRTPCGFRTRRASRRASTMPPCAIHHNDDASNTISNSSAENGKAVALAQRNCAHPRNSARGTFAADRISGSFVSIPTTERSSSAYRKVNRPSPAPTSRTCALRKSTAWRIAARLNASRIPSSIAH